MNTIPLVAVPSQQVIIPLNGQNCQINVYQKRTGLYLDLYVSDVQILTGVYCPNLRPMVLSSYLGFIGDLMWIDNQGTSDPVYTGLGDRFSLLYLFPADIPSSFIYS